MTAGYNIRGKIQDAKKKAKTAARKDYYKILELEKGASEADIKKAYRKQALKWHPDRWSSASEEEKTKAEKNFKDIGEAYAILSDPKKKERYDNGWDINDIEQGFPGGGFGGGIDPTQIFNMFFGGPGGGGGMGGMGGMGGGSPFDGGDIFS